MSLPAESCPRFNAASCCGSMPESSMWAGPAVCWSLKGLDAHPMHAGLPFANVKCHPQLNPLLCLQFAEALVKQLQQLARATPDATPGRGSTATESAVAGGGSGGGGSAAALQAALWLRLALLSPLLPLVYASKEQGAERSLRAALAHALLRYQHLLHARCSICMTTSEHIPYLRPCPNVPCTRVCVLRKLHQACKSSR